MTLDEEINPSNAQAPAQKEGCLLWGLLFLFVLGTIAAAIGFLVIGWSYEQVLFEGSLGLEDFRWAIVLGLGLIQVLTFLILRTVIKPDLSRKAYSTLLWAWAFFLIQFPTRFFAVTDAQAVMAAQVGLMALFLAIYNFFNRKQNKEAAQPLQTRSAALGLGLSLLAGFPWVVTGAFGSILDMILGLVDGLLFGYCASLILGGLLPQKTEAEVTQKPALIRRILGWGRLSAVTLLVMVSGIAQNGNQLALTLPVLTAGWGFHTISRLTHQGDSTRRTPAALWIGLIAAWPLMLFDADELMAVIGVSEKDAAGLAIIAAVSSMIIILISAFVLNMIDKKAGEPTRAKVTGSKAFPAVIALLLAAAYLLFGNAGLHGEQLFVILKDQADLSSAAKITDYQTRRAQVYIDLVNHANASQADLRSALDRWKIAYKPYYLVNALEVNGGPLVRWWLLRRPEVDRVLDNPILRPLPRPLSTASGTAELPAGVSWNLTAIGADKVWEAGVTGKGIVVGQSDSGVQGDHPQLSDSYRGSTTGDNYNWYDPWYHTTSPADIGGHGTHTLGTILGNQVGVAPDAEWIGCVNLARNLGNPALYLDCLEFMLAPFPQSGDPFTDGEPELGANVINNSWGCPAVEGCDAEAFLPAVKALRTAGIFVVVSTGNSGYKGCGSVDTPPAIYDEVFSVGAIDEDLNLAVFSSIGPVEVDGSGRTKPDILAPGDGVLSSFPNSTYEIAGGTSMAGPHLVGVVALLWSANPSLIGDIERTEEILEESASPYQGVMPTCVSATDVPNNASGYGIVNAYRAYQLAVSK